MGLNYKIVSSASKNDTTFDMEMIIADDPRFEFVIFSFENITLDVNDETGDLNVSFDTTYKYLKERNELDSALANAISEELIQTMLKDFLTQLQHNIDSKDVLQSD